MAYGSSECLLYEESSLLIAYQPSYTPRAESLP
jgi:hypothetical protein